MATRTITVGGTVTPTSIGAATTASVTAVADDVAALATVATTGAYTDLSGTPSLAHVGGLPMVAFLGDSISNPAGSTKTGTGSVQFGAKCWQIWASMLSGGKFLVGHIGGAGGATTATVVSTWLPALIAEATPVIAPKACVVLIGTNDAGTAVAFATTKANLISIWTGLSAAGIEPILCTLTPRSGAVAYQQINAFIRWYAAANGHKLIDFAQAPTLCHNNDGTWLSGLASDGIHPTDLGAKAMGQIVADKFAEWGMLTSGPWLTPAQADGMNTISATNSLMMTDTGADGVPDSWALTGSGGTSALASATIGNKATVTRAAATTTLLSTGVTIPANVYVAVGMRISATVAGVSPEVEFRALSCNPKWFTFKATCDVPEGCVLTGIVLVTSSNPAISGVSINAGDGSVAVFSQPTIYDLTTKAILS